MSSVEGLSEQFKESDMFVGFHDDTLPSLVLLHSNDTDESGEVISRCKDDLMSIATPDGVLRAQKSERLQEHSEEVKLLTEKYFEKPIHNGLASFISNVVKNRGFASSTVGEVGSKTIVMTYATVHTNINRCLDDTTITYQLERLGAYMSEKQLEGRIHNFFFSSDKELLVLQCKPELDGEHMILARSIIEDKRNSYEKIYQESNLTKPKHVSILVHVHRADKEETVRWQFNFLSGWKQVFLDVIEEPPVPMNEIHTETIDNLPSLSNWSFQRFSKDSNCLLWCFKCIKYIKEQRSLESTLDIAKRLLESEKVYDAIEKLVMKYISKNSTEKSEYWAVNVACNKESLINSSTFSSSIENYLFRLVREPLAKIIYFLEQENAWPLHVLPTNENVDVLSDYEDVWCEMVSKRSILNINEIPAPLGTESYTVDGVRLKLNVPFSQVIIRKVNGVKEEVLRERDLYIVESEGEEHNPTLQSKKMQHCAEIVKTLVPDILDLPGQYLNMYTDDFLDLTLAFFSGNITRQERIDIGNCAFFSFTNENGLSMKDSLQRCVQFHLFVWTSGQQITDQIRMIDSCMHFVSPAVVHDQIRKFLRKCPSTINASQRENSFSENDNITLTDVADMTMKEERELSGKNLPCLKRRGDELHQPESFDQDDLPRKKIKKEVNLESEVTRLVSCNSKNAANELDSGDEVGESSGSKKDNRSKSSNSAKSDDEENESDSSDSESTASEDESSISLQSIEENEIFKNCFENILVTTLCEEMVPSEATVTRNGGLESWIRNSTLLLSLAFSVSNQIPAFHFLRLCVDYAKMVVGLQTAAIPIGYLYVLDEIARELKPYYLDAHGSLQRLTERLVDPLENHLGLLGGEEKYVVIQKFLAKFYSRCIDTYEDAESAAPIVRNVLSMDREDLVLLMKPVIYSLLQACQAESPGIFFDVIIDRNVMNNCPLLKEIDEEFKRRFKERLIHHDSYPAVLISDAICDLILKFDTRCVIEQLTDPECELLKCLRCATKVFNGGDDNIGLILLSSVAFLRVFYSMLSKHRHLLTNETSQTPIMGEINSLLYFGGNRRFSTLQQFLLKQVYGTDMSFYNLRKICEETETLHVIKSLYETNKIVNKTELVSVYRLPEYKEVKEAYRKLGIQDENDMLTILRKCQYSANYRLALLGILINKFYVKKAVGNLSDEEERLAEWLSEKSNDFPFPLKALLVRITGRETFIHPGLQISVESSTEIIDRALLILHIACVVASCIEGDNCPLFQYFSNPSQCYGTWIPTYDSGRLYGVFDQRDLPSHLTSATCCRVRMKIKTNSQHNVCPFCHVAVPNFDTSCLSTNKYCLHKRSVDWDTRTENMDVFAFRSLHLIVHACYYAGIATGISSNEAVSPLLYSDKQGSTSETTHEDCPDICLNRITDDLQCLQTFLSCNGRTAVEVMHLVVEECMELFQRKISGQNIFSMPEECLEWENEFVNIVRELPPKALGSARPLKEARIMFDDENEERPVIEKQILELDEYPSDNEEQNEQLKRVFRITKQPSFTELRSIFLNCSKDFQENHSVLALLLSKFDELPYLACLFPLLEWTHLVSSELTHRISRQEAQSNRIDDFINGHLLQQPRSTEERYRLRELFNNFKECWNKMRETVDPNLELNTTEMPPLSEFDYIGFCLTKGDLSIYLRTAINILQSIQNNVLDEMILISIRTQHPALSFLEKNENCCATMSVSLQEAKERDIINFDWSDEFLQYAHKLEYGHGEEIKYDFDRMERELANEIVFEKRYLTDIEDTFIFAKELFHSSAKILSKIRDLVRPQSQSLPEEICQGLISLRERRIHDAQKLLQHIEVLIFLLNMKSVPVEDVQQMTVEKFSEIWKSKLPSPFPVDLLPEPRTTIKLTHIAALYEALEDLLADGTIEGLPKQFRDELTDETKKNLNSLVDGRPGSLNPQKFLTALRRFVFRYLSAEKFLLEPYTPLHSCLNEPSLWSPDEKPGPDVIPREMTLANIHAIITRLGPTKKRYSSISGGISNHKSSSNKLGRRGRKIISRS